MPVAHHTAPDTGREQAHAQNTGAGMAGRVMRAGVTAIIMH
ncbi:hypothetical protein [Komagataeibacter sp. FXV3]|nr:hypothetical protein [Komagataeibacter sp. FXV3]